MSRKTLDSDPVELVSQANAFGQLLREVRGKHRLSQLALATEAETTQRHLSFMESGRSRPSRQMILRLSEAMELKFRTRNRLLIAAGYAPLYSETSIDAEEMARVRTGLDLILKHHEPYPAIVFDGGWDLLIINDAMNKVANLFVDVEAFWEKVTPGQAPNLMRLVFHPKGMRPYIANWNMLSAHLLKQLGRQTSGVGGAGPAKALLEEITSKPNAETGPFMEPIDHAESVVPIEFRKGSLSLNLYSTIATFGTPQDITLQELRIETFFPADSTTEAVLRGLAEEGKASEVQDSDRPNSPSRQAAE